MQRNVHDQSTFLCHLLVFIPVEVSVLQSYFNIAERLTQTARLLPDSIAIAEPLFTGKKHPKRDQSGKREYRTVTFSDLENDSSKIAAALQAAGVKKGMKLVLMVRQGIDFISLVFALYKTGAILVLIDPGMGIKRMLACLRELNPDGFVGIPQVHLARILYKRWFPNAKHNVIVGKSFFLRGISLDHIRKGSQLSLKDPQTTLSDPAAIIFTSGSTGVAKGVLYTHQMFKTQVEEISKRLNIPPGGVDLVGFPFFGLFNAGMGTTAIIPDMDTTRPGAVNPELFLEAANDWNVTQSFGSPALWNRVVSYCLQNGKKIKTLKRAVIAGAPVSFKLLQDFRKILPDDAEIITPYGATESLPLAAIESREILSETFQQTQLGKGICVGKFFDFPLQHRIIPVTDSPISSLSAVESYPAGVIGELLVSGPQCSPTYVTRTDANKYALVSDENGTQWRRVGDVGYFDESDRFWFCGRKSHRIETPSGVLFTIPCEAISNNSPKVFRSALVGVPLPPGYTPATTPNERQLSFRNSWKKPIMIVEPKDDWRPHNSQEADLLKQEVLELLKKSPLTSMIQTVLICESFPVDIRHNAKINRELLAKWAQGQIEGYTVPLKNAPIND